MRKALLSVLALLWVGLVSALGVADADTEQLKLIPDNPKLLNESLLWDKDVTLRGGVGYKDNVLLAPAGATQGSGFFTSGLDLSIFRLPLDGLEFNFTATGDDVRYWRNVGVNHEDTFLVNAQVQKYLAGDWRLGAELKYIYIDEVLEALLESGGIHPLAASGNTVGFRPFVRRDLGTNWWVELEAPVAREWWQSPLDDDWKVGGQASLGRTYGHGSQVSVSYGGFYVPHEDFEAADATGTPLSPEKRLALWRQVAELKWQHYWDGEKRWRSTTKLTFQYEQDNGAGYFNYYRYAFSEELRFHTKNWEVKGAAGLSYYDFPVQSVDPSSGLTLYLSTLDLTLRVERRIYKSLSLFASFEHEATISNDPSTEYKSNIGIGGLSFEF